MKKKTKAFHSPETQVGLVRDPVAFTKFSNCLRVSVKRVAGVGASFLCFFLFCYFQNHRSFVGQIRIKANIKKLSL